MTHKDDRRYGICNCGTYIGNADCHVCKCEKEKACNKKEKVTRWFSGDEKPTRKGMYQIRTHSYSCYAILYSYWYGKHWGCFATKCRKPYGDEESPIQCKEWRGRIK